MRNIKLVLQYDGSGYRGWQVQPGVPTVCGVLKDCLSGILGESPGVHASSRTDAGVHAKHQVVNFTTSSGIPPRNLLRALNGIMPPDIVCVGASRAPGDFNARFDARTRWYRYTLRNASRRSPFDLRYAYFYPHKLDVGAMSEAASCLAGRRDFSAFHSSSGEKENRVRNLVRLEVRRRGGYVFIDAEADGFLTHMVRIIAGTLLEAGRGRFSPEDVAKIVESRDRRNAGPTLPAAGLCLMRVRYG